MDIPLSILTSACIAVAEKTGKSLPFQLRGIRIDKNLIKAAMVVLNSSPEATLPQNCRNDVCERTPDGLDRRIKEYLRTDLRTANIISDVLAEAGIVSIVLVENKETGRIIKATSLAEEWRWPEDRGSATDTVPSISVEKVDNKTYRAKLGTDLMLTQEVYLQSPDVHKFMSWIETKLDTPGAFRHQYYLVKKQCLWKCDCLYAAYQKYWWPYQLYCPLHGRNVSGTSFDESFAYLSTLAERFRKAVSDNNINAAIDCASTTLTWGGVRNYNEDRVMKMGDQVCKYFRYAQAHLSLDNASLGEHKNIYMNSGFTKLYALLVDDFIIYDGRVGAALGLLGRLYAKEHGLNKIPETIEFAYGSGKVAVQQQTGRDRRDPGNEQYRLPNFGGDANRQTNDNIKASWLLKSIADTTKSQFATIPQNRILNERVTAIQAALFMIGYDVST